MDPVSITSSLLVVWFIQNFSLASQEAAKELGKGIGKGIVSVTRELVDIIYNRLKAVPSAQVEKLTHQIEQEHQIKEKELASVIDQLTQTDTTFAKSLSAQMQTVRNTLLNILDIRFTARDLNEVYFRLGLDADRLAGLGVPHKSKAEELIKYSEARHQLADLIQKMIDVNPSIV